MTMTYREIKDDMMRRITGGDWPPGTQLPGEIELSAEYGVARATVGRALRDLVEDGIIERRRKSGTRVRAHPLRQMRMAIPLVREEIEASGAAYFYKLLESDISVPPAPVAARMGLAEGALARRLACLHYADLKPYQLEDRWISLTAVPEAEGADFHEIGPNEWLVRQVPFTEVEVAMMALPADQRLAQTLECAPGTALFAAERQTFREGQTVTLVRLVWREGHRIMTRY